MNEAITQNQLSQAIHAYKHGTLDSAGLLKKFEELMKGNDNLSEQTIAGLKSIISESDLPAQLTGKLISKFSDSKTVIVNPSSKHSSSLLQYLMQWRNGDQDKQIVPDQIIRNTYRIVEPIGRGGMGEVWKAIDLIQDAGDSRDKYVAIKFINHEIRSHQYALKALVREFARYKKLIHPNIVKAYELNRDESDVFIVMEFLEGAPLKEFIKQYPNGISLKQAEPIIKGMCNALSYAHQEGIIHLDFKPGNVFYNTQNKVAKVIDFGIARLSKQKDRDKTRFDPGKLGAITTAYASIEMLIEADPDPRDDVYGLACVVYELLSGKHPFNGGLALKAERENMKPPSIKGLDSEVFQALCRGLSFDRKKRTSSAAQFYQELFAPQEISQKKRMHQWIIGSIISLSVIIIPILFFQAYDFWNTERVISAVNELNPEGIEYFQALSASEQLEILSSDTTRLALVENIIANKNLQIDVIGVIEGFQPSIQQLLFKQRDVRDLLIDHYSNMVNHLIATENFDQAHAYSNKIIAIYPDSKALSTLKATIDSTRNKRLQELEQNYHQCFNQANKPLLELKPCLLKSWRHLELLSPQHRLLQDPGLAQRYNKETSSAFMRNDLKTAESLLADWRTLISKETDQRNKLTLELKLRRQVATLIQQILNGNNKSMVDATFTLSSLPAAKRKEILSKAAVRQKLFAFYKDLVTAENEKGNFAAALTYIDSALELFSNSRRETLSLRGLKQQTIRKKSNHQKSLVKQYEKIVNSKEPDINALQKVHQQIKKLYPENPLVHYPGVAHTYSDLINKAILKEDFALTTRLFKDWKTIKPKDSNSEVFTTLVQQQSQALQAYEQRTDMEKRLLKAIQTGQLEKIRETLDELSVQLRPKDKVRLLDDLQEQLTAFYLQQIQHAVKRDNFASAHAISIESQQYYPKSKSLKSTPQQINKEKQKRIKDLSNRYWLALKAELPNGEEVFSYLNKINAIDDSYLEKNSNLFNDLKQRLVVLIKSNQTLSQVHDLMGHWDKFLTAHPQLENAQEIYRKSRNLIALYCLYHGRQLKQQNKIKLGDEFLMYGLSLDPISTVRSALEMELQKQPETVDPRDPG